MLAVSPILHIIESAHHTLNINADSLSEKPIIRAIRSAKERGVVVHVILEGSSYSTNAKKMEQPISTARNPSFYRAKYICNGHECEITTANFDRHDFHKRGEYLCITRITAIVHTVNAAFNSAWDAEHGKPHAQSAQSPIILAHGTPSVQMLPVIEQAGHIDVELDRFGKNTTVLNAMAKRGKDISLILPENEHTLDKTDADFLKEHGCSVHWLPEKRGYRYIPTLITGRTEAFVAQSGFTRTGTEGAPEMGMLVKGAGKEYLQQQFNKGWSLSSTN